MKQLLLLFTILFLNSKSHATTLCDLCKAKQPKGFENITHGEGPEGNIDYIIMYSAILIVGYTLFMSIKYLANPKEKKESHIKNIVTKNS